MIVICVIFSVFIISTEVYDWENIPQLIMILPVVYSHRYTLFWSISTFMYHLAISSWN